jgi:hypothetical protein
VVRNRTPQEAADEAAAAARTTCGRLSSGCANDDRRTSVSKSFDQTATTSCSRKVVRSNGTDEVLARAIKLLMLAGRIGRPSACTPEDQIELKQGARVIERSK